MAQYGKYLFAACWDDGNIAVIDKDTLDVLGWGYMANGMGATYRAGNLCADDFGNVYCYSADTDDILAKFVLNGMLGRIPSDGTPE
ncbi:hypothetical protein RZS08_65770, partial [Arthrospira platensis SPKY1]|nr:hypothetical protein [Arthrospira platensis SPKY1]